MANDLDLKDFRIIRQYFIYALLAGIICVLVSVILEMRNVTFLSYPISIIGYSIIAPAIIGYLFTIFLEKVSLDHIDRIVKERIDKLSKDFEDRIDKLTADFETLGGDMETNINVVKGAKDCEIVNIFFDRQEAIKEMKIKIEEVKDKMFVLAISGTDFFTLNAPLKDTFKDKILSGPFENKEEICRVLLIDPFCESARERAKIEQPTTGYYDTALKSDTFRAMEEIKELKNSNAPIDARFYLHIPIVFVLRVDDYMFIEQYHLGHIKKTEKIRSLGCIGKQVPVLLVNSKSNLFKRICSHFDYIWDNSEDFDFILKLKDWLRTRGRLDLVIKEKLPRYPARRGKYGEILEIIKKEEGKG